MLAARRVPLAMCCMSTRNAPKIAIAKTWSRRAKRRDRTS